MTMSPSPAALTAKPSLERLVSIRRCHGLGNVICLLPVLDQLYRSGYHINLITNPLWVNALGELRPNFFYNLDLNQKTLDLDASTANLQPDEHRTDEFGRFLGLHPPFPRPLLEIPPQWTRPFEYLRGCIVFAPEGGHPSRNWPKEYVAELAQQLTGKPLALVGLDPEPPLPCDVDLREQLELEDLFGILSVARAVITMDSAVLHITAALDIPTVAIFGGVDPRFRIRPDQCVVAVRADLPCCPCNKNETCDQRYDCICTPGPRDIIHALEIARTTTRRLIYEVDPRSTSVSSGGRPR